MERDVPGQEFATEVLWRVQGQSRLGGLVSLVGERKQASCDVGTRERAARLSTCSSGRLCGRQGSVVLGCLGVNCSDT